eukprot:7383100-Prymnesium_polylepis.3
MAYDAPCGGSGRYARPFMSDYNPRQTRKARSTRAVGWPRQYSLGGDRSGARKHERERVSRPTKSARLPGCVAAMAPSQRELECGDRGARARHARHSHRPWHTS